MAKPSRKTPEPLRTRHVFLDTEVYRRAGFNISNTQFELLAKQIQAGRLVLHVCDITLAELKRQLKETVVEKATEAKRLARDFNRIAQISGRPNTTVSEVDGFVLAEATWTGFVEHLLRKLRGHSILALEIPARLIFDRYFAGKPPFDDRKSKEFPDAFVVEGLARYCEQHEITMYVVSGDAALRRATELHSALIPLQTIDEVLAAATEEGGADLEAIVSTVFDSPDFDRQLTEAIKADLDFVDFIYYGPLTEGSVRHAELDEIIDIDDYDVAAFDGAKIGIILQASIMLNAKVRYLDEEDLRDRDDDIVPTELETWSRNHVRLKLYVSVDIATMRFKETELLTRDVLVE